MDFIVYSTNPKRDYTIIEEAKVLLMEFYHAWGELRNPTDVALLRRYRNSPLDMAEVAVAVQLAKQMYHVGGIETTPDMIAKAISLLTGEVWCYAPQIAGLTIFFDRKDWPVVDMHCDRLLDR